VLQIGTDKAEGLVGSNAFDEINSLDGILVLDAAAQAVYGVGRIDDDPPRREDLRGFADVSWFWILRMDGDDHAEASASAYAILNRVSMVKEPPRTLGCKDNSPYPLP
jgi:hypothetical protein